MTHLAHPAWTASVTFWSTLCQRQYEQNLKLMAFWLRAVPHDTARGLAAEADALKAQAAPRRSKAKSAA